jgi:hypothetical protein
MLVEEGTKRLGMKRKKIAEKLGLSQGTEFQVNSSNAPGLGDILLS